MRRRRRHEGGRPRSSLGTQALLARLLVVGALVAVTLTGCTTTQPVQPVRRPTVPPPHYQAKPRPRQPVTPPPTLALRSRSSWADTSPILARLQPMGMPWRITVHHEGSDTDDLSAESAVAERLRTITKVQERSVAEGGLGAGDLGYHFAIDRCGRIWEGRSLSWQGAHAGNGAANAGNIGIVLLGNFDVQEPTPSQFLSLRQLLENLRQRYDISPENIRGHDEVKSQYGLPPTRCPGRNLSAWVRSYRWQSTWSRASR